MSSEPDPVLDAAARAIAVARRLVPWYAGDFAPLPPECLDDLLRRTTCHLTVRPLRSGALAFALPPVRGAYIIAVNESADERARAFAVRHELGHVLAAHVEEPRFLCDEAWTEDDERAADLFALADLLPGWGIALLRERRVGWRRVQAHLREELAATFGRGWIEERLEDRAALRLRLWRERGV